MVGFIIVSLSPLPQHLRVLKYNSLEEVDLEEEDDSETDEGEDLEDEEESSSNS